MKHILYSLVIAFSLLAGALVYPFHYQPAQAQAPQVFVINTAAVATSTTWNGTWLEGKDHQTTADIFISIDQGSSVNTTTLALQVSPDGSTYVAHTISPTLVSANAADATSYAVVTIHGIYWRIVGTMSNTNTVTPTIKMVLR